MQNWAFSKTVFRLMAIVGVLAGMLTILGCPSEEEEVLVVAVPSVTADVNSTLATAFTNTPFVFSAGVPAFATTTPTTVTFTSPTTATISTSATDRIETRATFGSCTFTVTVVTGIFGPALPNPPNFSVNEVITVPNCKVTVTIPAGQQANTSTSTTSTLTFATTTSGAAPATVNVATSGQVTVNNTPTTITVTFTTATGAAGQ